MGESKLDAVVQFRATSEEARAMDAAAERAGLTRSAWLRLVALAGCGEDELLGALERARRQGALEAGRSSRKKVSGGP